MKKNIGLLLLLLVVALLIGYIFFNRSKLSITEQQVTMVDSIENLKDANILSEKQLKRRTVYELLFNDTLPGGGASDTFKIDCGTRLTPTQYDQISEVFSDVCTPELIPDDTSRSIVFPIYIHIINSSAGTDIISDAQIAQATQVLNNKYAPSKISFVSKGSNRITSDRFVNFNENDQPFLLNQYKRNGVINIFIFSSVSSSNGTRLNGYTTFNRGDDFIMLSAEATQNGTTFSHEMGHFFLLFHTHGKTNSGSTDELVDRASCSCTGDDVCDTPADPNLFGIVSADCKYRGGARDHNGALYTPDPTNIMSYAHLCRRVFSKGQYNRIRWSALKYRNYF